MHRRRAQAVVEFALTLAPLLLLVVGLFDVARAHMAHSAVVTCAREAARSGALQVGQPGWEASARQACFNLAVGVDGATLSISLTQTTQNSLPFVQADVTYPFHSVAPMVGALLGDPIQLTARALAMAG
jgi:hypothetical protein